MYRGWQVLSLVIKKKSTKSFASNWLDILKKAGMKLDCLEGGIIHLCPLIKKVVCIDFTLKCPNYVAWKSYEDALK